MKKHYNVIKILDSQSILINYGKYHGAKIGDQLRIIVIGPEVKDPNTDSIIGTLDGVKDTLSIISVYDNFSLCKKIVKYTKNALAGPLISFNTTVEKVLDLNVDKTQISALEVPEDKIIQVGDLVEIMD